MGHDNWTTSRTDMDSFLADVPIELMEGFVVYAYPPTGAARDRVAFFGPDARAVAGEFAALHNRIAELERAAKAQEK